MKVRTTLYPNGSERRGHTQHRDWDMPNSAFPASLDEAKKRSVAAMTRWLGTSPTPARLTMRSDCSDEFCVEGDNWKVTWKINGAVQRMADEALALEQGDNERFWMAVNNRPVFIDAEV